jgi:putative flippase GtrA
MAGLAATGASLASLALLVHVIHLTPRQANIPALLVGAIVNFVGNRRFAFHAQKGKASTQLRRFVFVEIGTLAFNALLFDLALRLWPGLKQWFLPLGIVTNAIVYFGWSYPLWHRVFRKRERKEDDDSRSTRTRRHLDAHARETTR